MPWGQSPFWGSNAVLGVERRFPPEAKRRIGGSNVGSRSNAVFRTHEPRLLAAEADGAGLRQTSALFILALDLLLLPHLLKYFDRPINSC